MSPALMSHAIEFESAEQAVEAFYQKGWTDGLPVVPPTEEKVLPFLGAAGLAPDEILGAIPERNRVFTAEKVAINAVMAGCLPEYFPGCPKVDLSNSLPARLYRTSLNARPMVALARFPGPMRF